MASSLVYRAALRNQTATLSRLSLNSVKNLSTSPSATGAASDPNPTSSSSSPSKTLKRRKKKNLFEVAQFLPSWGIGYHMAKTHWTGVSYQITKVNLYKDGRHGKAWGIVHKDGVPAADAPKKISGVHKRCWRYIQSFSKPAETRPDLIKPAENTPTSKIQAA